MRDNPDIVRLLLKYGADPTKGSYYICYWYFVCTSFFCILFSVNTQGYTELHVAAVSYNCSTLLPLLLAENMEENCSENVQINVKDTNGNTPLLWAVYKNLTTNADVLISKGT